MKKDHPQVFVRIRPSQSISELRHEGNRISIPSTVYDKKQKTYQYSKVFSPQTNNQTLWTEGIEKQLEVILEGRNITLLAYGVTGSGKTHTVFGNQNQQGIASMLFKKLINKQNEFRFAFSFLQIYNQNIVDLLSEDSQKLVLLQQKSKTIIPNIIEQSISTYDQLVDLIAEGTSRRAQSSTIMNQCSSRSHAILQLTIYNEVTLLRSKITIIDLAGSQKTIYAQSSKQILQGSNINKSLLALGNCLNFLSDTNRRNGYIPYRDSKLTRILKESLSGNARLIMIACISDNKTQIQQTLNTLNYASRASKIKWVKKQNKQKQCKQTARGCCCGYKQKWQQNQKQIKFMQYKIESLLNQLNKIDLVQIQNKCLQILTPEQVKQNRRLFVKNNCNNILIQTKKIIVQAFNSFKSIENLCLKLDSKAINNNQQMQFESINLFDHKSSIFSKRTSSESYHDDSISLQLATQRMKRDFDEGNRIVLRRIALTSLQ